MLMSKLKTAAALALVVSLLGGGAALVSYRAWADEKPAKKAAPVPAEAQNGEKLKALLRERRAFAKQQFDSSRRYATESLKEFVSLSKSAERLGRLPAQGAQDIITQSQRARIRLLDAQKLSRWAQRLLTAELELSDKKADRVAVYEAHLKRMKEVEDEFKKEVEGVKGGEGVADLAAEVKFHRLEAEILLEREKAN
jgi:hypothetical protein